MYINFLVTSDSVSGGKVHCSIFPHRFCVEAETVTFQEDHLACTVQVFLEADILERQEDHLACIMGNNL